MYDAIVVGARCAGAPTAMLLARQGYRVLLVDRTTFPSDTVSTHHIHRAGLAHARHWGLLPRLLATNGPRIRRWTFDVGPFALVANPLAVDGIDFDLCPRRTVLDKVLVDSAAEAGAEVREAFSVEGLLVEDGRVSGVEGRTSSGAAARERARIVIGADGRRSRIARLVDAAEYNSRPALTFGYYSYWSGVELDGLELYPRAGRGVVAEVTNDGLVYVAVGWPRAMFAAVRGDIAGHHLESLQACAPGLAERVRHGQRVAPFKGADFPFFFRRPYGPGWALVGDAGYHRDAISGQGITDAFRDADLLAEAVNAGFSGQQPLDTALAEYEHQRNAAVMPMYEFTYDMARLAPPTPEQQQLFGVLRTNPAEARRFLSTLAGSVPVADFFAEHNLRRIVEEALPRAA